MNGLTRATCIVLLCALAAPLHAGARPRASRRQPAAEVVTLHRLWSRETRRLRLVDDRGAARPGAVRALRELLRPRDSKRRRSPDPRLVQLLARVAGHFGGKPLHIVSGVRRPSGSTKRTSRHVAGQAVDFRIPGVALTTLRDYCEALRHVGVGYYPRSKFVHLDVRRRDARWTDWSLPGQPPMLSPPVGMDPAASTDGADDGPGQPEPSDDEPDEGA